ncbi:transposase [Atopobium sp. oral taxon 416]|nr:transposase [Atopobium sp. oral taxon 416]
MAGTFRQERKGILNWWEKGSTNSFLKGLNSLVQSAESAARGFRNMSYFKTMIFLRLENSTSRPRDSWPVLPTRDVEEPKNGWHTQACHPKKGEAVWQR